MDEDPNADFDFRDQKNQEVMNVGLLAALLFTVAFDMVAGAGDDDQGFETDTWG